MNMVTGLFITHFLSFSFPPSRLWSDVDLLRFIGLVSYPNYKTWLGMVAVRRKTSVSEI